MSKKYIVTLSDDEQGALKQLTHKGRVAARRLTRAHILQMAHDRHSDEQIADALKTSVATIERVRERFVVGGLDFALREEPRSGSPRKLNGKQEAFLIALACTTPPTGHTCWTMQLLAEKFIESQVPETDVSDETVRRILKKTISSLGYAVSGASQPSAQNLSGAWKMFSTSTPSRIIRAFQWFASMNVLINSLRKRASHFPASQVRRCAMITNISARALAICLPTFSR
jgi:transposase